MVKSQAHEEQYIQPFAEIKWLDDGTPFSPIFNDIYWGEPRDLFELFEAQCLAEKRHAFLSANKIPEKFEQLGNTEKFCILETGFGFGLNFLLTVDQWQKSKKNRTSEQRCILHYLAFEQAPISPRDLQQLNRTLKNTVLTRLIEVYPLMVPGTHYLWLYPDVCLSLVIGDINKTLPSVSGEFDSAYLDGFSPAKNQEMWHDSLFLSLANLLKPSASLSSYTSAGFVRRGLQAAGFEIVKTPGFGKKSQMITAVNTKQSSELDRTKQPSITIIGAGISGILCATALEKRNCHFHWLEAASNALGAVKGVGQLSICPKPSASPQLPGIFSLLCFEYAKQNLKYQKCGRLHVIENETEQIKADKICHFLPSTLVEQVSTTEHLNVQLSAPEKALYYPDAGWIDPETLLDSLQCQPHYQQKLTSLEATNTGWRLTLNDKKEHHSDIVILATGSGEPKILEKLPTARLGGQSIQISTPNSASSSTISSDISLFPEHQGQQTVAGTFRRESINAVDGINQEIDLDALSKDTDELVKKIKDLGLERADVLGAAYGIRRTSRDRLPIVGPVPNWAELQSWLDLAEKERRGKQFNAFEPGLYCATGYGSHGATTAAYSIELLVRMILKEPHAVIPMLALERFALRDKKL